MIGRGSTACLVLFWAVLFSAIAVQSASATAGTNTTAFTCVKVAAGAEGEFKDEHCDSKTKTLNGYKHDAIAGATEVETTNESTSGVRVRWTLHIQFIIPIHLGCKIQVGTGIIENSEPSAGVHKITGSLTRKSSNCEVVEPKKCTVKEPIIEEIGSIESQEGLTGPKSEANAMGLELKAAAGKPLTEITLEGAECALAGKPLPVEGSMIETSGPGEAEAQTSKWSGATKVVTTAPSMSKLTAGGKAATLSSTTTYKMKGGGNAITATTVT